jgi:type IV pilus assembly protein PilY1
MKQTASRNVNMKITALVSGLVVAMLAWYMPASAEDIDLFVQPGGGAAGLPNVLILLDNTANWSRNVDGQAININELAALIQTVDGLPVGDDGSANFRVGLMLFTETGNPNNNVDGGYVRAAIRDMDTPTKQAYMDMLASLDDLDDKSNGGKAGKTMSEVYRYFKGLPPVSGNSKVKTDYLGNVSGTPESNAVYALPGNAIVDPGGSGTAFDGSPYASPLDPAGCGRNYVIYISNGAAQDNTADNRAAATALASAAAAENIADATDEIPISPSGSQRNIADEWSRFLYRSSVGAVTYTVDVDRITNGQGPGWTALLQSMANVSTGKYFSVTSGNGGAEIADALGRIFSEIQAVNSVFASVSLPVSVNTEGTYLNQVFVGMFRPDANAMPRWNGNMKQYKLGMNSGLLRTLDADDQLAINPVTGFLTECARSFWTPNQTDDYWQFRPQGGCLAVNNSDASNYPDGNVVEKGAQAYKLRASTSRRMKTCSPVFTSCSTLTDFNAANSSITMALVNAVDATERTKHINWKRGLDEDNEDLDAATTTEMRASVHGDVIHSRPVAINYGTDADPEIVVFYGGNDGILRAVNGNRATAIGPDGSLIEAGGELWSFMAPEFYSGIDRLRDNEVPISFAGSTEPPARLPKPYGFDGPVSAYTDAGATWIFASMRRGGRALYAFDMTDLVDDPTSPSLLWKVGCPNRDDDVGCASGFDDIGLTWSTPKPIKTQGYATAGVADPMLIFGGGYDPCEDSDPHSCASGAKGANVYVVDAETGARLKKLDTDRPVAADVFVVPEGNTGLAKYAYTVDTGGNVYRIAGTGGTASFGSTPPDQWTITKIASLGCDSVNDTSPSTDCPMNRKFLFSPDVVQASGGGPYFLLVGSGDREKPLMSFDAAYGVENYFFMIKDNPGDSDWPPSGSAIGLNALYMIDPLATDPPDATQLESAKGWALPLRDHEQAVTSAITVFGVTTFSTHTPTLPVEGSCSSNLGTARVYNVRFRNAGGISAPNNRDQQIAGGGLPPSPVAGQVTLDNGVTVPFVIGADPSGPLEASIPPAPLTGSQPKGLTYWFIEK